jgi:hypothetical protein
VENGENSIPNKYYLDASQCFLKSFIDLSALINAFKAYWGHIRAFSGE